jgi:hypothetical protein
VLSGVKNSHVVFPSSLSSGIQTPFREIWVVVREVFLSQVTPLQAIQPACAIYGISMYFEGFTVSLDRDGIETRKHRTIDFTFRLINIGIN